MSFSIITWNVNGIRAAINKGFWGKMADLKPSIICLQEIKADDSTVQNLLKSEEFANWKVIWHSASKKGYSGTMILIDKKILKNEQNTEQNTDKSIEKSVEKIAEENRQNSQNSLIQTPKNSEKTQNSENIIELFETELFEQNLEKNLENSNQKNQEITKNSQENSINLGNSQNEIQVENRKLLEIEQIEYLENIENVEKKEMLILQQIVGLGNEFFDVEGRTTGVIFETENPEFLDSQNGKMENFEIQTNLQNETEMEIENLEKRKNSQNKIAKNYEKNKTENEKKLGKQTFLLLNCYYPQGGRGVERIEYKLAFYRAVLDFVKQKKAEFENLNVILTGDFNTTFADIDLKRPKENRQTTGCLPVEREVLNLLCQELDLCDVFRHFYPQKQIFTYWDQITHARERDVGWRIDFFLVSKGLAFDIEIEKNDKNDENDKNEDDDRIYESENKNPQTELENKFQTEFQAEFQNKTQENLQNSDQNLTKNLQKSSQNNSENNSKFDKIQQNKINPQISKIEILGQVFGSDHCPVRLEIT